MQVGINILCWIEIVRPSWYLVISFNQVHFLKTSTRLHQDEKLFYISDVEGIIPNWIHLGWNPDRSGLIFSLTTSIIVNNEQGLLCQYAIDINHFTSLKYTRCMTPVKAEVAALFTYLAINYSSSTSVFEYTHMAGWPQVGRKEGMGFTSLSTAGVISRLDGNLV